VNLSGHEIDVAEITAPVLIFAGNTDGIAPINAVKALVPLLRKAREVRFEIVPGGHLGMLTGRAARATTWVTMDEWIEQYSTPDEQPAKRRKGSKKAGSKSAPRTAPKAPAKKTAKSVKPKPAPKPAGSKSPGKVSPDRSAIGSNPERRFDSSSSRNLTRKS
jgi:polyhydroxyalkanoate synthase